MSIRESITHKRDYASVVVDSTGRVSVNQQAFFQEPTVRKTVDSLKSRPSKAEPVTSVPPSSKR